MNAFEQKVYRHCKENALFEKGDSVCVALSGGADSTALLLCLKSLSKVLGIRISAFHLNHKIRGDEAERDAEFCRTLCRERMIPFTLAEADVPAYAKRHKLSLEAAARKCRYSALVKEKASVIATAHTATDQVETVLYNLTRGAGLNGLCGIPVSRMEQGKKVVRPFLNVTREETEAYCRMQNQSFVTDSTNLEDDCNRNFLRHQVLPKLKQINPSLEKSVASATALLREDAKLFDRLVQDCETGKGDTLSVSALQKMPKALAFRVIRRFLEKHFSAEQEHILQVLSLCDSTPSSSVSLPNGLTAQREYDVIFLKTGKQKEELYCCALQMGKNVLSETLSVTLSENVHNTATQMVLDCDTIVGKLTARCRKEKDEITLSGGTKTVKALMIDKKIPLSVRKTLPVFCDEQGIVAVANCGVAKRCLPTKNTKKKVVIQVEGCKL